MPFIVSRPQGDFNCDMSIAAGRHEQNGVEAAGPPSTNGVRAGAAATGGNGRQDPHQTVLNRAGHRQQTVSRSPPPTANRRRRARECSRRRAMIEDNSPSFCSDCLPKTLAVRAGIANGGETLETDEME